MKDINTKDELLKRIAKGDVLAFNKFYDEHFKRVFQFARYFLKSDYSAQEVTSDVFISLWNNRIHITEIENLNTYLYAITKNRAYNYYDKQSRKPEFTNEIPIGLVAENVNPEEILITEELEKAIASAINELPERCKQVFLMAREGGLRYKDIAHFLDISEKTVQAQMITAMKKLGQAIQKYLIIFL